MSVFFNVFIHVCLFKCIYSSYWGHISADAKCAPLCWLPSKLRGRFRITVGSKRDLDHI